MVIMTNVLFLIILKSYEKRLLLNFLSRFGIQNWKELSEIA